MLHEAGWTVIRAWEHENPETVAKLIESVVQKNSPRIPLGCHSRGEVEAPLTDLYIAADCFHIDVTDLLPRRVESEGPALANPDGTSIS